MQEEYNPELTIKTEKEDYTLSETIVSTSPEEKFSIYQTNSDTLLISRENNLNHSSKRGNINSTLLDVKGEPQKDTEARSTVHVVADSMCNSGFQEIDEDLSNLKKFLSFQVGTIVPCLSATDLEADKLVVSDSLSYYFDQLQSGGAQIDTNLPVTVSPPVSRGTTIYTIIPAYFVHKGLYMS